MKRLLIIDGQNMFIRNYVMSPQLDINGNPLGGLTGFMRSLPKEVRRAKQVGGVSLTYATQRMCSTKEQKHGVFRPLHNRPK